jgi:Peptidase inhibitor family I36
MRLRNSNRIALVTVISLAFLISAGLPVRANHTHDHCTDGFICLFAAASFGGSKLIQGGGDSDLRDDGFNDITSSVKNRKNHTITLCRNIDFQGGVSDYIPANTNVGQVDNNDTASSLYNGVDNC